MQGEKQLITPEKPKVYLVPTPHLVARDAESVFDRLKALRRDVNLITVGIELTNDKIENDMLANLSSHTENQIKEIFEGNVSSPFVTKLFSDLRELHKDGMRFYPIDVHRNEDGLFSRITKEISTQASESFISEYASKAVFSGDYETAISHMLTAQREAHKLDQSREETMIHNMTELLVLHGGSAGVVCGGSHIESFIASFGVNSTMLISDNKDKFGEIFIKVVSALKEAIQNGKEPEAKLGALKILILGKIIENPFLQNNRNLTDSYAEAVGKIESIQEGEKIWLETAS